MNVLQNAFARATKTGDAGHIEVLRRDNDAIHLSGWSACVEQDGTSPPRAVYVFVDDRLETIITSFTPRGDMQAAFHLGAVPEVGFACSLATPDTAAPCAVKAYALSRSGFFYRLGIKQVNEPAKAANSFTRPRFTFPETAGSPFLPFSSPEHRYETLLSLLQCPQCENALQQGDQHLMCPNGHEYGMEDNIPLFLNDSKAMYASSDAYTNPYSPKSLSLIQKNPKALILDFGAGNPAPEECFTNVVREDFVKTPSTDIVSHVLNLPFKNESFDHVISESVFEHLADPWHYANELYRVMKKGGYIIIDTAFMQPIHMDFNYFNMSLDALKKTFCMFSIVESGVEKYQSASTAVNLLLSTYKGLLGNNSALSDIDLLTKINFADYDKFIELEDHKIMSAGVFIVGQKV